MSLADVMIINGVCVENGLIFLPIGRNQQGACEHDRESVLHISTSTQDQMCTDKLSQKGRCLLNVQTHSRKHETEKNWERRVLVTDLAKECETDRESEDVWDFFMDWTSRSTWNHFPPQKTKN